jgi:CheY-like chemotaxis protein
MRQILLVDDERVVAETNKVYLERFGYSVVADTNPALALDRFAADPEQFDLMITDMAMPEMDGSQLAENVLKIRPNLPIILCSGYCTTSVSELMKFGFRKYIVKPVKLSALVTAVQDLLDSGACPT